VLLLLLMLLLMLLLLSTRGWQPVLQHVNGLTDM
jgi:hypothetical protein